MPYYNNTFIYIVGTYHIEWLPAFYLCQLLIYKTFILKLSKLLWEISWLICFRFTLANCFNVTIRHDYILNEVLEAKMLFDVSPMDKSTC